jgi:Family of unknown function (DUF5317)
MRFILVTLIFACGLGLLVGGRLSALATLKVRWTPAALIGLALQLTPFPGDTWPLAMLLVSFVFLTAFAVVNLRSRVPGFVLIALGVVMNFTVIAVNQGMPVTREALVASHQEDTLPILLERPGAKHDLAGPDDHLMLLADVIPVPPLDQVVSLGDVLAYGGVVWLVVTGMRRREERTPVGGAPGVAEGAA